MPNRRNNTRAGRKPAFVANPAGRRRSEAPRDRSGPYDPRRAAVETLEREVGYTVKPHAGRLRVALAFPNTYFVGMSNLGLQTVYRLFNAREDVVCERVFLPPKQELKALGDRGLPLVTLESQTPVNDFDVFAFSVSFEWDYTNLLTMLGLAKIPVYAADRTARHPLIVIGGAVTFVNPEPLALFADVIAAGEGEVLVPALADALTSGDYDRETALRALATQRGFYIPSFYNVRYAEEGHITAFEPKPGTGAAPIVRKAAVRTTEALDPPVTSIFTPDTEFGSRFLVEVVRGCANLCRFCWAGYNYLPVRAFPADRILALAAAAKPYSSKAGLVSIALCDHPKIEEILDGLADLGYSISPASLRLDDLTPGIVRRLKASGERSLTIAPETGSDRLRRVINKTVTNDEILAAADMIFSEGIENLKLYFMIGLPTETDEDLEAIRDLTLQLHERMLAHARERGRIGRIIASVNPLVPKPGTAYQWLPMERPDVIDRKIRRMRELTAGVDNVYFNIKSERHSFYQALMSLGDRRVAPAIVAAERNGGNWRAAVAETGVDAEFFVFRDRQADPVLPWDIIDGGQRSTFFRGEFDKAMRAEWTLPAKRAQATAVSAANAP
ncbi:MAG TPA: radical SAM protein [Vicinamibacterales bacterium]|nr:radical SAM protein [Vicinamibacterales bacterium]